MGIWGYREKRDKVGKVEVAYAPRRKVIDKILVDAAVEAGVELREGFTVQKLAMNGEQVTGILGFDAQGESITEHATLVIGADGMRSVVAHRVQAPTYQSRPTFTCGYYAY